MATLKEKKPAILPLKSDLVPVDRKKHKSGVWEYFGIHKEYSASSWVVCLKCCTWVSRHDNTGADSEGGLRSYSRSIFTI